MCWAFSDAEWFRQSYWMFAAFLMFQAGTNPYFLATVFLFAFTAIGFEISEDIDSFNRRQEQERRLEEARIRFNELNNRIHSHLVM